MQKLCPNETRESLPPHRRCASSNLYSTKIFQYSPKHPIRLFVLYVNFELSNGHVRVCRLDELRGERDCCYFKIEFNSGGRKKQGDLCLLCVTIQVLTVATF